MTHHDHDHQHQHVHRHHDPENWDQRYAETDRVWSGDPNGLLVSLLAKEAPGTVLDIGCGEGADAIWLAGQGWQVTAIDISSVAVARGRAAALEAGAEVTWLAADVITAELGTFEVVSAFYPAFLKGRGAEAAVLRAVAPGGTLLFVHHADIDREEALSHGFDPDDYLSPGDVRDAAVAAGWMIEIDENRERSVASGAGVNHRLDWVIRALRPGGTA